MPPVQNAKSRSLTPLRGFGTTGRAFGRFGLTGEVGDLELGRGCAVEAVAPGMAQKIEGEHGDQGVTKEQKADPSLRSG